MTTHSTPSPALLAALISLPAWGCTADTCDIYDLEDLDCVAEGEAEDPDASDSLGEDGDADMDEACAGPIKRAQIDATDLDLWARLDLDACAAVDESEAWELGFQRFSIVINGGISGEAGLEATWIDAVALEDIDAVPSEAEWFTDALDSDGDGEDELVFVDWYDYDVATHVLTPKPRVYVLRSTAGVAFAIELEDYYSEAGSSGHVSLRWKALSD